MGEQQLEEEARIHLQRNLSRKLIQRKYEKTIQPMTHDQMLKKCFQTWKTMALNAGLKREILIEETQQQELEMQMWVEKRTKAMERVKLKKLQELKPAVAKAALAELEMSASVALAKINVNSPRRRGGLLVKQDEPEEPVPRQKLESILQKWPAPERSPHYDLRVWGVLSEAVEEKHVSEPLLDLLASQAPKGLALAEVKLKRPSTTSKVLAADAWGPPPSGFRGLRPATSGQAGENDQRRGAVLTQPSGLSHASSKPY